jgi:hypothetical protein
MRWAKSAAKALQLHGGSAVDAIESPSATSDGEVAAVLGAFDAERFRLVRSAAPGDYDRNARETRSATKHPWTLRPSDSRPINDAPVGLVGIGPLPTCG